VIYFFDTIMGNNRSRLLVGVVASYLVNNCHAFKFDMQAFMKIKAMGNQFNGDSLDNSQQNALMHVAGFNDMELYMAKQITPEQFKTSMKQKMKDEMIQNILQGGGVDISNPLWRMKFFGDKTKADIITESMPEPMQTIVRLSKDDIPARKEYGQKLLKQYQYKKFNKQGSIMSENMDQIMMSDNKQETIKKLLKQQMLSQIQDPLDRAMMYNMQQQQSSSDSTEKAKLKQDLKDLQTVKLFSNNVPGVSPVTSDDLYSFFSLTSNEIDEAAILEAAWNDKTLGGTSELDFERYFGSSAKQFSCRSHPNRLRVPCGVNQSADECLASGCCYNPPSDNADKKDVPSCYHDLYGKISSGMLRNAFIQGEDDRNAEIKNLFRNGQLPTLTNLLKEDYGKFIQAEEEEGIPSKPSGQANWWDAAQIEGAEGTTHTVTASQERTKFGRPGFRKNVWSQPTDTWQPHGPTASPFISQFGGVNPTAAPAGGPGGLDSYYQMWLEYTDTQDQTECALIAPEARVKCMDNYNALADYIEGTNKCKGAGCCFNEDAFMKGNHACYRASDYGTCANLPATFQKVECGAEGITEQQCLTNARCCYKPTHKAGDPWCFFKYSASLEEDKWCEAWNLVENRDKFREACFATDKKKNLFTEDSNQISDINNLVSEEQCLKAGCCYDAELTADALDWIINGLGQETHKFRCFAKTNPALQGSNPIYQEINKSEGLAPQSDYEKTINAEPATTCDVNSWENVMAIKESCGDNLSYYQCVYVNKCCYKATATNEPTCFKPGTKAGN